MQIQTIKISDIVVPEGRLRAVDPDWADALAGMFLEVGHKVPIDVIAAGEGFELIAGGHRLAAAKLLKWKTIDARLLAPAEENLAEELRLHEILENLARKDFYALERCEALHELKRIYEVLHSPEQKGTVERVIGTFQRDCAATLPGFIGHSVADRKVIENRKAFSARLGTDDAKLFQVALSASDLQLEADRWALE
ncbi:MAG: ParB N-terminal domain-containing protein [Roseibium sp.]|uniref:ParB N-terminal domain-containing protein n=1 Tax=Roseibium sp. TaxID=1936156 RepID=UPI003297F08D